MYLRTPYRTFPVTDLCHFNVNCAAAAWRTVISHWWLCPRPSARVVTATHTCLREKKSLPTTAGSYWCVQGSSLPRHCGQPHQLQGLCMQMACCRLPVSSGAPLLVVPGPQSSLCRALETLLDRSCRCFFTCGRDTCQWGTAWQACHFMRSQETAENQY